jgi:hypothetical protein
LQKVAVAIIHGMGIQKQEFADDMISLLYKSFTRKMSTLIENPASQLVIQPIYWAEVFGQREEVLYDTLVINHHLHYHELRKFIIQYLADAIAYQPVETAKHNYERVHKKLGENLHLLSETAGTKAPLCIISHSLGSVIASNYFYDLQIKKKDTQSVINQTSPLEKGDTLTLFYTMGTTLPLWSLRYYNFDRPIDIPSAKLSEIYPGLRGEWINFYDKDDILGYPLRDVADSYKHAVHEDREINVGNILTSWNPLAHSSYFTDKDVIEPITNGLVRVWKQINQV